MTATLKNLPDLSNVILRVRAVATARGVTLHAPRDAEPFLEVHLSAHEVRALADLVGRLEEDQPTVVVRVAE